MFRALSCLQFFLEHRPWSSSIWRVISLQAGSLDCGVHGRISYSTFYKLEILHNYAALTSKTATWATCAIKLYLKSHTCSLRSVPLEAKIVSLWGDHWTCDHIKHKHVQRHSIRMSWPYSSFCQYCQLWFLMCSRI